MEEYVQVIGMLILAGMLFGLGMAYGWVRGIEHERSEWRNRKGILFAKRIHSVELAELQLYKSKYPPLLDELKWTKAEFSLGLDDEL